MPVASLLFSQSQSGGQTAREARGRLSELVVVWLNWRLDHARSIGASRERGEEMRKTIVHLLPLLIVAVVLTLAGFNTVKAQSAQPAPDTQGDDKPKPEASPASVEEAFIDAVSEGNLEIVRKMLQEKPALIGTRDEGEATALHIAVAKSKIEIVKLLLEKKAEVNAKDQQGETPLYLSISADDDLELAGLLLAAKADPNIADADGNTPLHLTTERDVAELLIAKGADIGARNNAGRTPLHEAVAAGAKIVVEALLSNNADVNAIDQEGNTPLHLLLTRTDADRDWTKSIAVVLLAKKANVNARNKAGVTALKMALEQKDAALVELLRQNGARE
jgi:ankyrin repeat protein